MRPGDRIWCLRPTRGINKCFSQTSIDHRLFFLLRHSDLLLFPCSMETFDRKFEQVLALQQLDKSKAISQILQEVKGSSALTQTGCAAPGSDFPLEKQSVVFYI